MGIEPFLVTLPLLTAAAIARAKISCAEVLRGARPCEISFPFIFVQRSPERTGIPGGELPPTQRTACRTAQNERSSGFPARSIPRSSPVSGQINTKTTAIIRQVNELTADAMELPEHAAELGSTENAP